jgi:hypothetical protein
MIIVCFVVIRHTAMHACPVAVAVTFTSHRLVVPARVRTACRTLTGIVHGIQIPSQIRHGSGWTRCL